MTGKSAPVVRGPAGATLGTSSLLIFLPFRQAIIHISILPPSTPALFTMWEPVVVPFQNSQPLPFLPTTDEIRACTNVLWETMASKIVAVNDDIVVKYGGSRTPGKARLWFTLNDTSQKFRPLDCTRCTTIPNNFS